VTTTNWDETVDLLVLGAGPAGMTAALVGSVEGLNVLLCEKSMQVGGTGATSAGTLWIPGNNLGGGSIADDAAWSYLNNLLGPDIDEDRCRAFLDQGPSVVDYLAQHTDMTFISCGTHPDYRWDVAGGATTGRAIMPASFDARLLGRYFQRVRAPVPEFMLFGGMMVDKRDIRLLLSCFSSFRGLAHSAKLLGRYFIDRLRNDRGTRLVMGNALVARQLFSLLKRRVPIQFETSLYELTREASGVTGAVVQTKAGGLRRIRAVRGVVLATGGIGRNAVMREKLLGPNPAPHSMACETDTGDGVISAAAVGAQIDAPRRGSAAFWAPVSISTRTSGEPGLFPHLVLDRAKPGLVAVDLSGNRFVDEGSSYHDFTLAMLERQAASGANSFFLICDTRFVRKYGLGIIRPGTRHLRKWVENGYLYCSDTLAGLGRKLGVNVENLLDTIRRANDFAAWGKDLDFGKGDSTLSRFNGDSQWQPNPCLGAIVHPPFIAVRVWPAELGFSAGLRTDRHGRVLDSFRCAIEGLYACGNDMASIMGGAYPGPGTNLGPGIVFACLAAFHAARAVIKEELPTPV
jgi:hypothetical protein